MSKLGNKSAKSSNKNVCRTCLTDKGNLREIFPSKLPKMIEFCTSIQVAESDNLPNRICVTCFHQIAKFFIFKKKVEKTDRILRQQFKHRKGKQNDILNIALNDAEIEQPTDDSDTNKSENIIIIEHTHGDIEEEIDTSENVLNSKTDNTTCESSLTRMNRYPESTGNIFTDGPPPLIPFASVSKSNTNNQKLIDILPSDTPPLVPIKTKGNKIESVLSTVIEPSTITLQCNNCNQDFSTLDELKEHKIKVCQQNPLQCNICRKEFKESKKLIGHLKGHMVVKDYKCKICSKCYPNNSTFNVHMRTHTGERPFKCEICGKGFVRWAGVVGHMKTHESHKPYKCDTCGKCFKMQSNLERHKVLHSESLPFCCSYCGKTFSQSDNLQLHIRTYHTKERPFLCSECGKGFVSLTRLNRHMWIHSGYKPYQCMQCPKAYSNSNDLKNHYRNHSNNTTDEDKPYPCPSCNMRFYHPCRLQRHLKTHGGSCSVCMKNFSSKLLLEKHLRTKHSMEYVEEVVLEQQAVDHIFVQYE